MGHGVPVNRETFTLVIGYGTFAMWLVANALSFFIKDVTVNHYLNVAAMAIVGSSFGVSLIQRGDKNGGS